jgi:hypothetical protein
VLKGGAAAGLTSGGLKDLSVLTCLLEERYEVSVALFEQRELGVLGLLVGL